VRRLFSGQSLLGSDTVLRKQRLRTMHAGQPMSVGPDLLQRRLRCWLRG